MQNAASFCADWFDAVLSRLPPDLDLDALARQTKAIERKRVLETGSNLLRLSLARGPGGLSLSQTAAWATMLGFAQMSDPAVKYRLDKAVDFLQAALAQQLAAKSAGAAVRWAGRVLRASDGTCIRERGSKTSNWRVHAVYDLGRGGFSHRELTDDRGAEAITRGAPIAGEIRIADRYFARAGALQQLRQQSGNQADFIVRVGWSALSLTRPDAKTFDLIAHLRGLPHDMEPHDIMVLARTGKTTPALPLRLIIQRKAPRGDRGDAQDVAERGIAQAEDARPEQPGRGRIHDPRHLAAGRRLLHR